MTMDSPCHNCGKRNVTAEYNCHSDCKDYADYKVELAKKEKPIREQIYTSYIQKAIYKRRKKKNEKNRI